MYLKILNFICALVSVALSESTSIEELKSTFGSKICIEGAESAIL